MKNVFVLVSATVVLTAASYSSSHALSSDQALEMGEKSYTSGYADPDVMMCTKLGTESQEKYGDEVSKLVALSCMKGVTDKENERPRRVNAELHEMVKRVHAWCLDDKQPHPLDRD